MKPKAQKIWRQLEFAWTEIGAALAKMSQGGTLRPTQGSEVFKIISNVDNQLEVAIGPAVFNLPERATNPDLNLFVVIEGRIVFEYSMAQNGRPTTSTFSTRVGYFRVKKTSVQHVYGAHYDFEESKAGHPVFHAQMNSLAKLWDSTRSSGALLLGPDDDLVTKILRNVRIPTAQMDVFSVIVQVCADHLITSDSPKEVLKAFEELRKSCNFFSGAAERLEYLNKEPAISCYRSSHWYAGAATARPR